MRLGDSSPAQGSSIDADWTALMDAASDLAAKVPYSTAADLSDLLSTLPAANLPTQRKGILGHVSPAEARSAAATFISAWGKIAPCTPPSLVAAVVRTAAHARRRALSEQSTELVWTGPAAIGASFRRTEQALIDVIAGSRASLLVVMFVAYDIAEVGAALADAARRGVCVEFVLETPEGSGGKLSVDGAPAIAGAVAAGATVYTWPREQRPTDAAGHAGSLHVKCVVADNEHLLLSSANLTGFAMSMNMELGVVMHSPPTARAITSHFRSLMASGVLEPT